MEKRVVAAFTWLSKQPASIPYWQCPPSDLAQLCALTDERSRKQTALTHFDGSASEEDENEE
jgi:hypothetical protein